MLAAADDIPEALYPKIKALVMFGHSGERFGRGFPEGLQEKVLMNCAEGDPVSIPLGDGIGRGGLLLTG